MAPLFLYPLYMPHSGFYKPILKYNLLKKVCTVYLTNIKKCVNNSRHKVVKGTGMTNLVCAVLIAVSLSVNFFDLKKVETYSPGTEVSGSVA